MFVPRTNNMSLLMFYPTPLTKISLRPCWLYQIYRNFGPSIRFVAKNHLLFFGFCLLPHSLVLISDGNLEHVARV